MPETNNEAGGFCLLTDTVRALLGAGDYAECRRMITKAMGRCPSSAQPHNLFGLLLERTGCHAAAMRHFRAALALEPGYEPAKRNLEYYGTLAEGTSCAFDERDCRREFAGEVHIAYDAYGVGHVERKA